MPVTGLDSFLERIENTWPKLSIKCLDDLRRFIENSNCGKIEVFKFKHPALGCALHDGVSFNENIFDHPSSSALSKRVPFAFFLFVVFHEIIHQYQFKKYSAEKMYSYYIDDIDVSTAAREIKRLEMVADRGAERKIKEYIQRGWLPPGSDQKGHYRNAPEKAFEGLIHQIKNLIKSESHLRDYKNVVGISELFYDMIRANPIK